MSRSRILYALYLFFIVFLSLEIILRFYNPFHFRVKGNRIVLPANERLVIHNTGNPRLDPVIINSRNSLGFRGPEKPAGFDQCLSVVTVGGSATECHFLSDDKTWPWLLAGELKKSFPSLWLNNAGLDGHSTFGHQVLLNDYLVAIRPKLILFLTGMNEIENEGLTFHDKQNIRNTYNGFLHFIFNNSEALNLGLNLVRRHQAQQMNNAINGLQDLRKDERLVMTEQQVAERRQRQAGFLAGYRQRLVQLIDTCRTHAIEPVCMTQPDLLGRGRDSATGADLEMLKIDTDSNGKCLWTVLEMYNDVTRQVCREKKVAVIDLASEMPKNSLYYYDHSHFTNEGAKKVAEITAIHLKDILSQLPGAVGGMPGK